MLNSFELNGIGHLEVFPDGDEFYDRLGQLVFEFDLSSEELTIQHSNCDLRLVEKMEAALKPVIGESGLDEKRWWHSMDYHGNGVRLVEAEWTTLSVPLIQLLHDLLVGEHERFCILWKVYEDLQSQEDGDRAAVAIFNDRILAFESVVLAERRHA